MKTIPKSKIRSPKQIQNPKPEHRDGEPLNRRIGAGAVSPFRPLAVSFGFALLLLLALGRTASAQSLTFTSNTFAVGDENSGPDCVAAADINGDGRLDLISANYGFRWGLPGDPGGWNTNVVVLTNNGSGGFALNAVLTVGHGPSSVVTTDVNGDGKPDLICANETDNTLTVLTNNGSGALGSNATLTVGSRPHGVAVADFNRDHQLDLACVNAGANSVTVLTNQGGAFVLSATLPVGNEPLALVASDVNDDGKPDLTSVNKNDDTLTVLTNDGSGGFAFNATIPVGHYPNSVSAADFNGDGKMDLVSVNWGVATMTVLTNGGGSFGVSATLPVGNYPSTVAAADFNGDGKVDLICASTEANSLRVLTNNGSGVFGYNTTLGTGRIPNVWPADLNRDGKLDLACPNFRDGTVTVLLNTTIFPQHWPTNNLPPGLVAWWQAEGNFSDLTGANPGTAGAGVSFTSGQVGNAFRFVNSPDSTIRFPNAPAFAPTNRQLTITAWIKPDFSSTNLIDTILEQRDACGSLPYSFIFSVLKAYPGHAPGVFGLGMLPQIGYIASTNRIPDDGRFHHVAVTYNGHKANGNCLLYLDGRVVGGGDGAGPIPTQVNGPVMGVHQCLGATSSMAIDEVGFFDRELSAAEIVYLCLGPDLPVTAGLKLHLDANNANGDGSYPSNNASVTTWHDLSGFGLDAAPLFGVAPVYRPYAINGRPGVDFGLSGSDALATALTNGLDFTNCTIFLVSDGANSGTHISISAATVMQEFCIFDKGIQHHSSPYHYIYRSHQNSPPGFYIQAALFGVKSDQLASFINGVASTNQFVFGQQSPTLNDVADYAPVARQAILGWRNSDANGNPPVASENFAGVICEVLVYDRQLSPAELNAMHLYLAGKYGIAVVPIQPELRITLVNVASMGTNFTFAFQTVSNLSYTVEYNGDLNTTNWLLHHTLTGDGSLTPCLIPMTNGPQRFFRVRQP
ncbi:MAG: VCBS repeat-containing protein [Verrucomicrobia bacterium]|nr:VCBS repeat-containing protein [Verrucomicrobiota bacterium]